MRIFEKYGGPEIIDKIVENFYDLAIKNKNLSSYFKYKDIDSLKKHQSQLFKALLSEPLEYNGREFYEATRILNFAPAHYDDVRKCLIESMKMAGVENDDIDFILTNITTDQGMDKIINDLHF